MAQTPCLVLKGGSVVEHTAAADIIAGEVIVTGSIPMIATQAADSGDKCSLESSNQWKVPQKAEVITAGDAVHWDDTGDPYGGTAGSGAATATATSNTLMGECLETTAADDTYVKILLTAAKRTATIAGAVTATSLTGSDATLDIAGIAGSTGAGGAIPITGGAGDAGAGGAVPTVGGAGSGNAAGGAVTHVGGAGAGTGDGGAASLVGGAVASSGSGDGGAASVTGGATGTGANANGGAVAIAGGTAVGAANGDGGAVVVAGGAGPLLGDAGGALSLLSGAGDGTNGTAGAVILDSSGTGATKGAVTIATNAASLTLGKMPRVPMSAVVAGGANQATANNSQLVEGWNLVSAQDNTKGVQLPSCVDGAQCVVINQSTDKTLPIYPPLGKQVNLAGANNSITVVANSITHFASEGENAWYGATPVIDTA